MHISHEAVNASIFTEQVVESPFWKRGYNIIFRRLQ